MPRILPATAFSHVTVAIAPVAVGEEFGHIHRLAYPDPLRFGKTSTRFSDPCRRVPANRFGVLYLGSSLKVCFIETILRDDRDGIVGEVGGDEAELDDRCYVEVRVRKSLRLLVVKTKRLVPAGGMAARAKIAVIRLVQSGLGELPYTNLH